MRRMGRYAPIYSDRQRAAVIFYGLDAKPRVTCPKIVLAAAAGELADGLGPLEPFTLPVSTARYIVRTEKEKRRRGEIVTGDELASTLETGNRVLVTTWKRAVDAESRAAKPSPEMLRQLALAGKALAAAQQRTRGAASGASKQQPREQPSKAQTFLETLARSGNTSQPNTPAREDPARARGAQHDADKREDETRDETVSSGRSDRDAHARERAALIDPDAVR